MSKLGRAPTDVIIIDNSPLSFAFQPENGLPILSWYDDPEDTKLLELIPVLRLLSAVPDVRPVLLNCCTRDNVYMNDKSIALCSRIIEEQQRRSNYQASNNDQGSNSSVMPAKVQQLAKQSVFKPMIQNPPKLNTWTLVPPPESPPAEEIQGFPQQPTRSKRNQNQEIA